MTFSLDEPRRRLISVTSGTPNRSLIARLERSMMVDTGGYGLVDDFHSKDPLGFGDSMDLEISFY